jgi:hypothetical protein
MEILLERFHVCFYFMELVIPLVFPCLQAAVDVSFYFGSYTPGTSGKIDMSLEQPKFSMLGNSVGIGYRRR